MKARVFYCSKTGNTEKVARAIAKEAGCEAESISSGTVDERIDLLFLGSAVYATSDHEVPPEVKAFIRGLDPGKVGKAALFCTGFTDKAVHILGELLGKQGIALAPESFFCKGRFLLFMAGHPDKADLEQAGSFARRLVG